MAETTAKSSDAAGNGSTRPVSLKEHTYVNGIMREVFNHVPQEDHFRVLEVGCGGGRFSGYLNDRFRLVATDINMTHFDRSLAKDCCQMDVHKLALADDCCDIAFCHFVLHHFEDLEHVSSEMARIASQYLIIIEPNPLHFRNMYMALFDPEEKQLRKYSMRRVKNAAEACGFQHIVSYAVGLLPHFMVPDFLINILLKLTFHQPFGWDQVLIMKRNAA
jgi:ubiquinone/menaquinone biosynthesis C-methylase UbiE